MAKWCLINVGKRTLLEKFPNIAGYCFCDTLAFPCDPPKDVVQILNVANTHWIYISSNDCKPGTMIAYAQEICLCQSKKSLQLWYKKKIVLLFPNVQQQSNSSTVESTLCEGKDPTKVKYDFPLMWTHFLDWVQWKEFPSTYSMYLPAKPLLTSFKI